MAQIGYFSFILALFCVCYGIVTSLLGLKTSKKQWHRSAAYALHGVTLLFTTAVMILLALLLQRNFQIQYVASYTNLALPTVYLFSALWAGQEGSLLFWGWLISLCSSVFIWKNPLDSTHSQKPQKTNEDQPPPRQNTAESEQTAYTLIALAVVLGFFLILLLVMANPFERLDFVPQDGKGMNPLLQNLYMAIHPPLLFIGYAGFIVPFALAFGILGTGTIKAEKLNTIRRWTLFAWYFLGMGIILGAHWAYLELGWGGYWAWDPVENASFIPWLTGTALLHTLALQRRKGLLKLWNIFLCILTFALCIFATFVTRSGMIESVHAFGESAIGYYFLAFLTLIFLVMACLLVIRWQRFRTQSVIEVFESKEENGILRNPLFRVLFRINRSFRGLCMAVFSKEGSFFLMNQLFMGLSVAVMYGTLYPFFMEILTGKKITVDTIFFNRISIPVGLVLLALIGICQRIPWKNTPSKVLAKHLLIPCGMALTISMLLYVSGVRHVLTVLTCWIGLFVVFTMLLDMGETLGRRFRNKTSAESSGALVLRTLSANKRLYAAYIFHFGIVLMYLGIAVSSAYKIDQEATLRPGASVTVGDVRFQYGELRMAEDPRRVAVAADITVYRNEQQIAVLNPQKHFYGEGEDSQMTTEIGLHTSLQNDLYVILAGWKDDQTATFYFIINPMIIWIWVGGFLVCTLGIIVVVLPKSWGKTPLSEV